MEHRHATHDYGSIFDADPESVRILLLGATDFELLQIYDLQSCYRLTTCLLDCIAGSGIFNVFLRSFFTSLIIFSTFSIEK